MLPGVHLRPGRKARAFATWEVVGFALTHEDGRDSPGTETRSRSGKCSSEYSVEPAPKVTRSGPEPGEDPASGMVVRRQPGSAPAANASDPTWQGHFPGCPWRLPFHRIPHAWMAKRLAPKGRPQDSEGSYRARAWRRARGMATGSARSGRSAPDRELWCRRDERLTGDPFARTEPPPR